eukprot:CAMPEP_0118949992 /NCGR_PEP_ID=MMETSP1169-20130426/50609_1 /TAXON_ID=36882 /ORGANISM="Pyramimonas obovata, Strain CCMP722" /LENGTH=37 /DNA_ID= /DNA_START= /DNA_END= /DNA_ORIENTATION=
MGSTSSLTYCNRPSSLEISMTITCHLALPALPDAPIQ